MYLLFLKFIVYCGIYALYARGIIDYCFGKRCGALWWRNQPSSSYSRAIKMLIGVRWGIRHQKEPPTPTKIPHMSRIITVLDKEDFVDVVTKRK